MKQELRALLVAGGGKDWNETCKAKSLNLGPRFFGRQQSVKFTEFLTLVAAASVPFPRYCQRVPLKEN